MLSQAMVMLIGNGVSIDYIKVDAVELNIWV